VLDAFQVCIVLKALIDTLIIGELQVS
jgi:hypothetical protein